MVTKHANMNQAWTCQRQVKTIPAPLSYSGCNLIPNAALFGIGCREWVPKDSAAKT
jgi:hypothetical protein